MNISLLGCLAGGGNPDKALEELSQKYAHQFSQQEIHALRYLKPLSHDAIERFWALDEKEIYFLLAQHPSITRTQLEYFLALPTDYDRNDYIKGGLALHPALRSDDIEHLIKNSHSTIHAYLAMNPTIETKTLLHIVQKYQGDESFDFIVSMLGYNKACHAEVIVFLQTQQHNTDAQLALKETC